MQLSEDRVVERMFRSDPVEATEVWRKLLNE
jgi:hypothetical protein